MVSNHLLVLSYFQLLIVKENCEPSVLAIKEGIKKWTVGEKWALRKQELFDDKNISYALEQLAINNI